MRAFEFLTEDDLRPANLFDPRHLDWRPQRFLEKLKNKTPFMDKNRNQYFSKDGEYERLEPIITGTLEKLAKDPNSPLPTITINMEKMVTPNGEENTNIGSVSTSKLEKADIAKKAAPSADQTGVNVQPIGIGIAASPYYNKDVKAKDKVPITTQQEVQKAMDEHKDIVAGDLFNVIMNNKVLDTAGVVGEAVKDAAQQIQSGKDPDIKKYPSKVQDVVAIDAGEYLGILALVNDIANFPKKEAFLKFLREPNFQRMRLIFPGEQNSKLSDSYGVQNPETGQTIMISSKGGRGSTATGAAPALSGLKPSLEKRSKKIKPGNALDFISSMIAVSPTTVQGFAGINWLSEHYPDKVPEKYRGLLPFYSDDMRQVLQNIKSKNVDPIPEKFLPLIQEPSIKASKGTDGGKLAYVVVKDLVNLINSGIIKDFRSTVLELLEENFIQIFTRVVGGKLKFDVLWPGKVDGEVLLWTKISPAEPGKQGLSFKVID